MISLAPSHFHFHQKKATNRKTLTNYDDPFTRTPDIVPFFLNQQQPKIQLLHFFRKRKKQELSSHLLLHTQPSSPLHHPSCNFSYTSLKLSFFHLTFISSSTLHLPVYLFVANPTFVNLKHKAHLHLASTNIDNATSLLKC